jgi:RNA polymerase sigma factor (sigma-70 family)
MSDVINGIDLRQHLGLIGMVTRSYSGGVGNALDSDDLFNAAYFGLRRAAEKFDPARGCKFSTYALHWVRHHVQRTIADQSRTVRVPVWFRERARRMQETLPPDALSLDAPIRFGDGETKPWLEMMASDDDPTEPLSRTQRREVIEQALDQLPERTRDVLRSRFWNDESLAEIGRRLGLSRERIRQLEAVGLQLLREELEEEP